MPATLLPPPSAAPADAGAFGRAAARVLRARALPERFAAVRAFTVALTDGLAPEDFVVQSMADVSPAKWHLAHTTWFWEQFVLRPHAPGYRDFHPQYAFLFNSYYVQAGERHCRAQRGYLSRPTVAEVLAYRAHVDEAMGRFLEALDEAARPGVAEIVELGLNHEQQHQELIVTDLKHIFSVNPLRPVYRERPVAVAPDPGPMRWVPVEGGVVEIGATFAGATARERFAFDNEGPRHRQFVEPMELADRLVTAGEYLAFMADGGYRRPELWLSEGWATAQAERWEAPFYWTREAPDAGWRHFTLAGMRPVDPHEPVTHLSYFEADAFARWAAHQWDGARLPTEFEWEAAAAGVPLDGGFGEGERFHPAPAGPAASGDGAPAAPALRQLYGEAWQWTQSQYTPYPGFRAAPGAVGEYNGKWMSSQFVLRGASCATSRTHARRTYRNFFPPAATWQFTGVRLARSA